MNSYVLSILLCFVLKSAYCQNIVNSAEIHWVIPETEDTLGFSEDDLKHVLKEYHVLMQVSGSVNSVEVKMGLGVDSDDLLGGVFSLQQSVEREDGSAIIVSGNSVDIRLGFFQGLRSFKLRLLALNEAGGVLDYVDLESPEQY